MWLTGWSFMNSRTNPPHFQRGACCTPSWCRKAGSEERCLNPKILTSSPAHARGLLQPPSDGWRRDTGSPPASWSKVFTIPCSNCSETRGSPSSAWDENGEIAATPEAKDAFSVEVATNWERVFNEAPTPGTRKVAMRAGLVLGLGANSVFPVLRRLVRLGLGGKMGNGRQFVSWIHAVDYCRAVEWLLNHPELSGVINVTAPNPLPNHEMMRTLRELCGMPFGLPAARWMLELGAFFLRTETELVIKSRRVIPRRLLESGFQFRFPGIRSAFEALCRHS